MANASGWYDPVSYQFYFFAVDDQEISEDLLIAYRQFVEDLAPFYRTWLEKGGRLIGNLGSEWQSKIQMIFNEDDFAKHQDSLSTHENGSCSISPVSGKALACFATPARNIPKAWRDQASRYTDFRQLSAINKSEQKEWLYHLINCPTDDLRGIYFPKRSFVPGHIPFILSLSCDHTQNRLAYADKMLQDVVPVVSDSDINGTQCFHRLHVSIPRYILDSMDQSFTLQSKWKMRLTTLSQKFKNSVGYMKMDACTLKYHSPVLTGNGNFILGFSQYLPDIAWAMCLTKYQVAALGGLEYLRQIQLFHHIEALSNGNVCLQLTPDISFTSRNEASRLWTIVAPHLRTVPYNSNSIADVPASFRLGLERDQLQMKECGQYRIIPYGS